MDWGVSQLTDVAGGGLGTTRGAIAPYFQFDYFRKKYTFIRVITKLVVQLSKLIFPHLMLFVCGLVL